MYNPPKPKYSPEKLYKSDINDLVEEELAKGGKGSGVRGHKTSRPNVGGDVGGSTDYFGAAGMAERARGRREYKEHDGKRVKDHQLGHEYAVMSEDDTHYHVVNKQGHKFSIHRTQATEIRGHKTRK